jgi:hypothetical protein
VPNALRAAQWAYEWPTRRTLTYPIVAGIRIPGATHQLFEAIVPYVRANVPEGEPIYVGLGRHDSVMVSMQIFYYLADRPVASRYNELHPGIVDRDEIQREIIGDLERLKVRCAILWNFGWPKAQMDAILEARRREIAELGATRLDEYLRSEFEEVLQHGEFVLMWRKGVPRAPVPDAASGAAPGVAMR